MKNVASFMFRLALCCASGLLIVGADVAASPAAYVLRGEVVRVTDGDTVRMRGQSQRYYTIRLASIDAPEAGQRQHPGQPFAQVARRALEDRVLGRSLEARCYEVDGYGRDICDLVLPEGGTVSQSLVAAGMAWANLQYGGRYLRDAQLTGLQAQARQARKGLWVGSNAVEPWVWRDLCWRQGQC